MVNQLLNKYHPNYLINFATETHVDKSIDNPKNLSRAILTVFFLF